MGGRHALESYVDEAVSNATLRLGAHIGLSTNQVIATGDREVIEFDTVVTDQGGWFNASEPGKFTVPSGFGIQQIQAVCYLDTAPIGGGRVVLSIEKNGELSYSGSPRYDFDNAFGMRRWGAFSGPWTPATAGDVFEVSFLHNHGSNRTVNGVVDRTWFQIEGFR